MAGGEAPGPRRAAPWLMALALLGGGAATALLLTGRALEGGLATAAAGVGLAGTAISVGRHVAERFRFAQGVAERLVEGAILGALTWTSLPEQAGVAAAALLALGTAYLAAYLRAKAIGLGFDMGDASLDRYLHLTLVAVGLIVRDALVGALLLAALVSTQSLIRQSVRIARSPEAG